MTTTFTGERLTRMFLRLAQDADFTAWVESQRERSLSDLVEQTNPPLFHQTQGRIKFLNQIQEGMAVSKSK